ncbi:MAG TPA: YdcF family protein [Azospirillaceae bacterium]|nr:YdcF family protein [Azospirillaceae bacterium]
MLRRLRVLLLGGALAMAAWGGGFLWFVSAIPRESPSTEDDATRRRTDAIVVLTGGSERLGMGLELLGAGLADKLFVSGVHQGVDVEELLRVAKLEPGDLETRIVPGYTAVSTEGNAEETAQWMRAQGYRSLRLVTANYHMRRSLLEFHMAMPGAEVIAHPVAPASVRLTDWWRWRRTTLLLAMEFNKYLVALARFWLDPPFDA